MTALLLRKRNTRSFTALYEKIINNIENEGEEVGCKSSAKMAQNKSLS